MFHNNVIHKSCLASSQPVGGMLAGSNPPQIPAPISRILPAPFERKNTASNIPMRPNVPRPTVPTRRVTSMKLAPPAPPRKMMQSSSLGNSLKPPVPSSLPPIVQESVVRSRAQSCNLSKMRADGGVPSFHKPHPPPPRDSLKLSPTIPRNARPHVPGHRSPPASTSPLSQPTRPPAPLPRKVPPIPSRN